MMCNDAKKLSLMADFYGNEGREQAIARIERIDNFGSAVWNPNACRMIRRMWTSD
jgi:hypothetical protein